MRVIVRGSLIIPPLMLAFAALQHFHYRASGSAAVILVGAVLLSLAGALHKRGFRADIYVGALLYLIIGGVSYFRGGMMGPIVVWGVALPTAAALLGRSRGAVIWLVLWGIEFGVLTLVERAGLAPPRIEASPGGVLGGFAGTAAMLVIATMMMNRMREDAETAKRSAVEQLHRANKTEAIGRLAGGVAHDFNNLVIEADPKRMHQVVMNLALNARDALRGGDGARELYLRTHLRTNGAANEVVLEVTDTGAGMGDDVTKNLFEPFFTTKPPGSGSGLGLAVVHGIVTRLGGAIEVESDVGRGTTMRVVLEASTADVDWQEEGRRSSVEIDRNLNILLVEDDQAVRTATRRLLRLEGHEVMEAEDGSIALDLLRERGDDVDVVLTDVVMPIMSGPQLVRELRRDFPGMSVIYMSGYAGDELDSSELEGDAVFLQKPVSRDGFQRALMSVGAPPQEEREA